MVAARAIATNPPADLVPDVTPALAQLSAENRQLAGGRVKLAVPASLPCQDRRPEFLRAATRERGVALADRLKGVGVARTDAGQAVPLHEGADAHARSAQRGRVERLEGVRSDGWIRILQETPQEGRLGAQRIGEQGMGRNGQTVLCMDLGDARAQGLPGPDRLGQEQPQEVAPSSGDLLADDDLDAQAPIEGHDLGGQRGVDPLMIGDGDDVEVRGELDTLKDLHDPGGTVRGERVDMQVRPAMQHRWVVSVARVVPGTRFVPGARRPHPAAPPVSRSGQIGKKTAHHCAGARAISRSKARACASSTASTRSRREPAAGTTRRSIRPM